MRCRNHHANPDSYRYCQQCGVPLQIPNTSPPNQPISEPVTPSPLIQPRAEIQPNQSPRRRDPWPVGALIGAIAGGILLLGLATISIAFIVGRSETGAVPSEPDHDQASYELGFQAGQPSGYAGNLIYQGINPDRACLNAQEAAYMFADDPVLQGVEVGTPGRVPSNSADYLQGCLDAAVG